MLNLKNVFMYPFINIKYLMFILFFCVLAAINEIFVLPSLIFLVLLTTTIIGYKLINKKLSTYKKDCKKLTKYFFRSLITNIVFSIFQIIILSLIIIVLSLLFFTTIDVNMLDNFLISNILSTSLIMLFVISFLIMLFVEFLKNFGILRYFKTNKFNTIFNIKTNTKLIFSSDFFVSLLYYIGYLFVYFLVFLLIGFIFLLIFPTYEIGIISFLIFFFIYISYSGLLSICYQTMANKEKIK